MLSHRTRGSKFVFFTLIPLALLSLGAARAADRDKRTEPTADGQPTAIDVRVPLGAIVWFDGTETRGNGALRRFLTPPLKSGHRYYYDVRVTWTQGERAEVRERHVSFRAGERVLVDFAPGSRTRPEPTLSVDPAAPTPWRNNAEMDSRNWPNYPDYRRQNGAMPRTPR